MPSGDVRGLPVQAFGVAATAAAAFTAVSGALLASKAAAQRVPMRKGGTPGGEWDSFEQLEAAKKARASPAAAPRRRASCGAALLLLRPS